MKIICLIFCLEFLTISLGIKKDSCCFRICVEVLYTSYVLWLYRGSPATGRERGTGKVGKREKRAGAGKARIKGKMSL